MKRLFIILISVLSLCACGSGIKTKPKNEKSGGVLHLAIYDVTFDEYIFPPTIHNELEKSLASVFYTGLFRYNPFSLEVENALCKTWEVDNTGAVYIFNLDSTAMFHRDECFGRKETRHVTAYDVKYTYHLLANPKYSTFAFTNTVYHIKGAKDYFSLPDSLRDTSRIEGIQVLNDYALKITLDKPSPSFIHNLAHPSAAILPFEAVEKYGDESTIGAGPFTYEADSAQFRFIKNDLYNKFDANRVRLPYLDSVTITRVDSIAQTVDLFVEGKIDAMLMVPSIRIKDILKRIPEDFSYEISESNIVNLKGNFVRYNIVRSYVKDLYTNKMNILDFERTYIDKRIK
ncbi:MAG: hypothetical protein IKO90_02055 [Bacteroidales bacterium]|nr:hypothetical protein [Bacteroidales bacterium]MBR7034739.1 hypothetical protein [Bacteroidales bacterium]